jgi:hypothetical protein
MASQINAGERGFNTSLVPPRDIDAKAMNKQKKINPLRTLPPDLLAITISRLIKLSITSLLSY